MISERLQGKLPALPDDATVAQRNERAAEEWQRDRNFIVQTLASSSDAINAHERLALGARLYAVFAAAENALSIDGFLASVDAQQAVNKSLADRIAALESAAKPA